MTNYRPGDVVLVPFPFADLASAKRRPALVLASIVPKKLPILHIIAMITSQTSGEQIPGDYLLKYWSLAGLIHPSKVRLAKVVTLELGLVIRGLGTLDKRDWKASLREFLKLLR